MESLMRHFDKEERLIQVKPNFFSSLLCSLNSFSGNSTWPDWRNYQQDGICIIRLPNHEGDPFIAVTFIIEKKICSMILVVFLEQ